MYQWDKYTKEQQEKLKNLQIAREDQWKEDILVRFNQKSVEYNEAFNDVVDEHAVWFAKVMTEYLEQVANTENARFPEWLFQVWNLGPDRLAYLIVRATMESIYNAAVTTEDNPSLNTWSLPTAQILARDIATKAWEVASWLEARKADPFFYRYQSKYFKNWNPKRRRAFAKKVNALPRATTRQKDNFGHAMIRLAIDAGLLLKKNIYEKKISAKKTRLSEKVYVTLPSDLIQYMMTRIEEFRDRLMPNRMPMICRPVNHTENETGGLMDWSIRRLRKVAYIKSNPSSLGDTDIAREVDPSCMSHITRTVINTLQKTEWKINSKVLQVVNDLWQAGRETGTIPPYDQTSIQNMPDYPEEGTKTEKHEWLDEKSRRWASWAKAEASRLQMQLRMHEAYKLKPFVLWHAYFCDFRGRYYSDSYLLHPQGADLDKALIMAAEPEKVTPQGLYWIKVNLANLFGIDKVSFDDRVQWVDDRMEDWVRVVADPHGTTNIWEDDAPKKNASFQRLAAIFDLLMAIDDGLTQVPVQIDGSCNGIQHWAAMTRDEIIGPEVNLVSQPKPADVYQRVADGCTTMCVSEPNDWRKHFLDYWNGLIPRKVVKRSVMCDPYGISDHSVRQYVLQEKHLDWCSLLGLNMHQAANEMGTLICESKSRTMKHCNHGKLYVQLLCGWVGGETDKPMSWISPSGFLVINEYNPRKPKPSQVRLFDKKFQLQFGYYTDEYDCDKALTAMPPNFVHSLDAAHMSLVMYTMITAGIEFFSMIHDSFGTLANSIPLLREITKEKFYEIHSTNQLDLIRQRAEDLVGYELPEHHPARSHEQRGELRIEEVLNAEYLFG
tara:strand:- start:3940 stop:6444 length:2505 start_codon:yes stop_codon:yes gene_type:complete